MIKKIISGGQTGADRAALDFAIKMEIPHGGWVPKGRLAEDGPLPSKYHLKEMRTKIYAKRTEKNVVDSDDTLIVSHGKLSGGSQYTMDMAILHEKPWLHIDLTETSTLEAAQKVIEWTLDNGIETLNIAGPRARKDPVIYDFVIAISDDTNKILKPLIKHDMQIKLIPRSCID